MVYGKKSKSDKIHKKQLYERYTHFVKEILSPMPKMRQGKIIKFSWCGKRGIGFLVYQTTASGTF